MTVKYFDPKGDEIKEVKDIKYLGVKINNELAWKN